MNVKKQTALPSWPQWVLHISGALGACHLTLPGDHPFPVGLLTHLNPAKYTVSVTLTVINLTVCLLFSQGGWLTYRPQRCLSTLCRSLSAPWVCF